MLSDSSGQLLRSHAGSPCIFAVDNLTTEHRVALEPDPHMVLLTMRLTMRISMRLNYSLSLNSKCRPGVALKPDPHMVLLTMRLSGTACGGLLPRVILSLVTNKINIRLDGSSQLCLALCTQHSSMMLSLYCCVVQRSESTKIVILMQRQNQQN